MPESAVYPFLYEDFIAAKSVAAPSMGFEVLDSEVHPMLLPHQRAAVIWAVAGGRRALFEAFGLGKTVQQLEICRIVLKKLGGGRALIVAPLGVRQEFRRDAAKLGLDIRFVRRTEEVEQGELFADGLPALYLTNYESVRDGRISIDLFDVVSLDEASCLRGFGGSKTFREFMRLFENNPRIRYRYVATATPSPNEYIELLAYAAFLEVMDVGQAKTRFFKRNSEKADNLTIHPHKEEEFWAWMATWALFLQRPSDLGFSDEGYDLPPVVIEWHEIPSDYDETVPEKDGQGRIFPNAARGVVDASREKRRSLEARVAKLLELRAEDPGAHRLLWHDLEDERRAIEAAIPGVTSVYGTQDLDEREQAIVDFSDGRVAELAAKPVLAGSGCNFQYHCSWAIYLGIGFKFNDFIQSLHRLLRYQQREQVRIDVIYTAAEREVRRILEEKWQRHRELVEKMTALIRDKGLAQAAFGLTRSAQVERVEVLGDGYRLVRNDAVQEARRMEEGSVDLIVTSIPFSTQYEYSPSLLDFGHTDDDDHFWSQMDFLIPQLFRVLAPGRVAAIHCKDRITPGGINGFGFQTVSPFSDDCIRAFRRHGFAFLARKTIVTDVVRENNQTYRLGWTEQCKDGSRMGAGMPEYILLFRKPQTDRARGYADKVVTKAKKEWLPESGEWLNPAGYSRARWQLDAHGYTRSSGERLLDPGEVQGIPAHQVFKLWRRHSMTQVYDFENHVAVAEGLETRRSLPPTFMLLPPHSWHPDVWTDVARMRTLNSSQAQKGQEMHLCLARGSLILTRGGLKPIQEVVPGELVLTHKGRWRPVLAVQPTGVRPVVELRAQGIPGLTLTPDHKVWTRDSRRFLRQADYARRVDPGWVEAQETVAAYVNRKLPLAEESPIDRDTWWIVGRWLADGHITSRGGAVISCGLAKRDELDARLGTYGGNPHHHTGPNCSQILLRDPSRKLRGILDKCGRGATGKHLPPEAFTLSAKLAAALLDGYLSGDGHFRPDIRCWTASSVSRALLLGMAFLAQRAHGALASVYPGRPARQGKIEGREVSMRQDWIFSFNLPGGRRKRALLLDDGAWMKVRSADPAGEVETWNLRVEEDESFTAEGMVVKNCPLQFDIVDRIITQFSMEGEVVYDPFGGIMTVPVRALRLRRQAVASELNAHYFADGAVYTEAAAQARNVPTLFDLIAQEEEADEVPGEA